MARRAIDRQAAWRAIHHLRQAEALLALGNVAGPADAPPAAGQEQSFIDDWVRRTKAGLKKAAELAQAPQRAVLERSRDAAKEVARSAKALASDGVTEAKRIFVAAENTALAMSLTYIVGFAVSGYLLYRLLKQARII